MFLKILRNFLKVTCLFIFAAPAILKAEIGFEGSKILNVRNLSGRLIVACASSNQLIEYTCRTSALDTSQNHFFNGPAGLLADRIELVVNREDGSMRTRTLSYNSKLNRSESRINLWFASLTNEAFLRLGLNKIFYRFFLRTQVVLKGETDIYVRNQQSPLCKPENLIVADERDCLAQFTLCQKYFEQNQYCSQ